MTDQQKRALCKDAGFDPDDAVQWKWWAGLSKKDMNYLAGVMDRGSKLDGVTMPTFTDCRIKQ